eukprot:2318590-Alexandrium_andersonii.AAC.1
MNSVDGDAVFDQHLPDAPNEKAALDWLRRRNVIACAESDPKSRFQHWSLTEFGRSVIKLETVSYTHLTLPTICSV